MYARDVESALRAAGENPYWRQPDAELVLSLWQDSGQSLSAFGRQFGISVQKLRRWRRRLRDRQLPRLYPVELVSAPAAGWSSDVAGGELEVVLRGGRRVVVRSGFDEALLAQVAQVVESWAC